MRRIRRGKVREVKRMMRVIRIMGKVEMQQIQIIIPIVITIIQITIIQIQITVIEYQIS